MKVSVKDVAVTMDLGNNSIELDVYDNIDKHLGGPAALLSTARAS